MKVIDLFRRAILSSSLETLEMLLSYPLAPNARELATERAEALREMSEMPTYDIVRWISPANNAWVSGTRDEHDKDMKSNS